MKYYTCRNIGLIVGLAGWFASSASYGLMVMNVDPSHNYVAPTSSTSGFAVNPDPGWANISSRGIYLGNQWILAPRHTGAGGYTEQLDVGIFKPIPGTTIRLKNVLGLDQGVSENSDLVLFRIDTLDRYSGIPEVLADASGQPMASITIAASSAPTNSQLMVLGNGRVRQNHTLYYWERTSNGWGGQQVCVACFQPAPSGGLYAVGYQNAPTGSPEWKAWGTNRVEQITNNNFPDDPNDPDDVIIVNGARAVAGSGHTFMQLMDFDEYSFTTDVQGNVTGGGGNEVQAMGGDSGSAVFRRVGTQWELTGLVHLIANHVHSSRSVAIRQDNGNSSDLAYGDVTLFTDLSKYRDQILAAMQANENKFSVIGDINLDGKVSGDGTGNWETDDVTALIHGWGWQGNGPSTDIISWKYGDLNRDGVTDLHDFLLLRDAMGSAGASLNLAQLLTVGGGAAVPEPSTLLLCLTASVTWAAWRKCRR